MLSSKLAAFKLFGVQMQLVYITMTILAKLPELIRENMIPGYFYVLKMYRVTGNAVILYRILKKNRSIATTFYSGSLLSRSKPIKLNFSLGHPVLSM